MNVTPMEHIPIQECKDRMLYRIVSRNLTFGIFKTATNGFMGIREKFGRYFLFTEFHYDTGAPFGTAHPQQELEPMPQDMALEEILGIVDNKTGRPVAFDKPVKEGGKGWYYLDTDTASTEISPVSIPNEQLFDWLKRKEGR
mgnify:CR=1 FL=1